MITNITLACIYAAALLAYLRVARTLPERDCLRAFVFLMTLPLVIVVVRTTENPLTALVPVLRALWRGPSG